MDREIIDVRKRIYLAMLGIFALFVWAGFLVGPVLALLASVMHARKKEHLAESNREEIILKLMVRLNAGFKSI